MLAVQLGRHGDRDRVDPAEQLAAVEQRAASPLAAAISSRARAVGVDDRDELDARQRRQNPRVMPAEMADADDRDSQTSSTSTTKTRKHEEHEAIFVHDVLRDLRVFVVRGSVISSRVSRIGRRCRCRLRPRPG